MNTSIFSAADLILVTAASLSRTDAYVRRS